MISIEGNRIIVFTVHNHTFMAFYQDDRIVHMQENAHPGQGIFRFVFTPVNELESLSETLKNARSISILNGEFENSDFTSCGDPSILPYLFLYNQNAHDLLGIQDHSNNGIFNFQLLHKSSQKLQEEFKKHVEDYLLPAEEKKRSSEDIYSDFLDKNLEYNSFAFIAGNRLIRLPIGKDALYYKLTSKRLSYVSKLASQNSFVLDKYIVLLDLNELLLYAFRQAIADQCWLKSCIYCHELFVHKGNEEICPRCKERSNEDRKAFNAAIRPYNNLLSKFIEYYSQHNELSKAVYNELLDSFNLKIQCFESCRETMRTTGISISDYKVMLNDVSSKVLEEMHSELHRCKIDLVAKQKIST